VPKFKKHIAEIGETAIKRETAHYITDMVLELRNLARGAELKSLSELLELAYCEAYSTANKVEVPPAEFKRLKTLEQAAKDLLKPVVHPCHERPEEARSGF
jgi:hypothetical protein